MKALLLSFLLVSTFHSSASSCGHKGIPTSYNPLGAKPIEDGWYTAIVKPGLSYSKYRLNVKVQYDRVVAIDFGNGGSVHTGFNNEGYIYGGGYLSTYGDEATATVSISSGSDLKYFYITLE